MLVDRAERAPQPPPGFAVQPVDRASQLFHGLDQLRAAFGKLVDFGRGLVCLHLGAQIDGTHVIAFAVEPLQRAFKLIAGRKHFAFLETGEFGKPVRGGTQPLPDPFAFAGQAFLYLLAGTLGPGHRFPGLRLSVVGLCDGLVGLAERRFARHARIRCGLLLTLSLLQVID